MRARSYNSLDELDQHIEQVAEKLIQTSTTTSAPSREFIQTFATFLQELIRAENEREALSGTKEPTTFPEGASGFPDQRIERQALFTSSVVGPLFTSATSVPPSGQLAPSVHLTKVLPTAHEDVRVLGDLRHEVASHEQRSLLEAGRFRLPMSKRIKNDPFVSFAFSRDQTDAVLDDRASSILNLVRHSAESQHQSESGMNGASTNNNEFSKPSNSVIEPDFGLTDDVLDVFQTEKSIDDEITVLLIDLARKQESRVSRSPFLDPDEEELAAARSIQEKLQTLIVEAEIAPRKLLTQGIRPDYTMAKFSPSYSGSLPPTIAQAIKATLVQSLSAPCTPLDFKRTKDFNIIKQGFGANSENTAQIQSRNNLEASARTAQSPAVRKTG